MTRSDSAIQSFCELFHGVLQLHSRAPKSL